MSAFANTYKGKSVFITGHTGFKGSWLTAWLLELGANVTGFSADVPTSPSAFTELSLADRITDITGDIRDESALRHAIQKANPDIVFHLAAQSLVRESYREPLQTLATNALGTAHVFEALRHTPTIKACVCITSDKAYRNNEWEWGYRETDTLGGDDLYSASKGCAEIIAHAYMQSFLQQGPRCSTVRAGNVIGGGDWAKDRIVPDCARAWAAKNPVHLRSPHATRPWQHVLEPLSGYLWLGAKLIAEETGQVYHQQAFNFGPAQEMNSTVKEVVTTLAAHWPDFTYIVEDTPLHIKESTLLKLCCDKANIQLQWRSVLDFAQTLDFTAQWYSAYYAGNHNMLTETTKQIAQYTAIAREKEILWANTP